MLVELAAVLTGIAYAEGHEPADDRSLWSLRLLAIPFLLPVAAVIVRRLLTFV